MSEDQTWPTLKVDTEKEEHYNAEIKAKVDELSALCKQHGIAHALVFDLDQYEETGVHKLTGTLNIPQPRFEGEVSRRLMAMGMIVTGQIGQLIMVPPEALQQENPTMGLPPTMPPKKEHLN